MAKEIETVELHCKHPDCIYRIKLSGGRYECCMYAAIEHQCRGCKISECDKFKHGAKIKPMLTINTDIVWEIEYYEDEDGRYTL